MGGTRMGGHAFSLKVTITFVFIVARNSLLAESRTLKKPLSERLHNDLLEGKIILLSN